MYDPKIRPPVVPSTPKPTTTTEAAASPERAPVARPAAAPATSDGAASDSFVAKATTKAKAIVDLGIARRVIGLLKGDEGPRLPGIDRGWVPQGQAYDPRREEILTSYYETVDGVEHGHLGIMSKDGKEKKHVALGGTGECDGGLEGPSHAGGVATEGDFVYVSDTEGVYAYRRADIDKARPGEEVEAVSFTPTPQLDGNNPDHEGLESAGSTMAVSDGYAYVAGYSENEDGDTGAVWRYKIDPETGGMVEGSLQGPIRGPDQAQGMTVTENGLLFTSGDQTLYHQTVDFETFEADEPVAVAEIDGYAQGVSIVDGEVWITYESGSDSYDEKAEAAGYEVREHIQRIPLEELDLDGPGGGGGGGGSW